MFPDDTLDAFDNPRIEYLSEYLHRTQGKALGLVRGDAAKQVSPSLGCEVPVLRPSVVGCLSSDPPSWLSSLSLTFNRQHRVPSSSTSACLHAHVLML